jgi:hypothetical protein
VWRSRRLGSCAQARPTPPGDIHESRRRAGHDAEPGLRPSVARGCNSPADMRAHPCGFPPCSQLGEKTAVDKSRTARSAARRPAATAPSSRQRSSTPPGSSSSRGLRALHHRHRGLPRPDPAGPCSTAAGRPAKTCCAPPRCRRRARHSRHRHAAGRPARAAHPGQHHPRPHSRPGEQYARQLLQPGRPDPPSNARRS